MEIGLVGRQKRPFPKKQSCLFIGAKLLLLTFGFLCFSSASYSNETQDDVLKGKFITGKLPTEYLVFHEIILNKSTLSDVVARFGAPDTFRQKETIGPYSLCYIDKNNANVGMLFEAGPLGNWNRITSLHVGKLRNKIKGNCLELEKLDSNLANINIGMDRKKFVSLFSDKASFMSKSEIEYNYVCDVGKCGDAIEFTGQEEKDLSREGRVKLTGIRARFVNYKLDLFRIHHLHSD